MGQEAPAGSTTAAENAPSSSGGAKKSLKKYTAEEVAQHKTEKDCWVVVEGKGLIHNTLKILFSYAGAMQCWMSLAF